MSSLNNYNVSGNLTKDPELRYSSDGSKRWTQFSIGVHSRKDKSFFLDVTAFDKTADFVVNNFKKGQGIILSGELDEYTREKDGVTTKRLSLVVTKAMFNGKREEKQATLSSQVPDNTYGNF